MKRIGIVALAACLLDASPVQACQLMCVKTTTRYTGNLGGLAGADAKCAAELGPNWKYPRSSDLYDQVSTISAFTLPTNNATYLSDESMADNVVYNQTYTTPNGKTSNAYAWNSVILNPTSGAPYNCANWTSSNPADYGGGFSGAGYMDPAYTGSRSAPVSCDLQLPLVCCNM